jgi:putative aldouronate transport system substrate-binding protein
MGGNVMRKHIKTIALALCLLIVLGIAASCTSTPASPAATPTDDPGEVATEAPPQDSPEPEDPFAEYEYDPNKTYEISWYTNSPNGPAADDAPVKLKLEEDFNIKFNMWYVDRANREELLSVRFASGEFPDVLTATGASYTQTYYNQGLTAELPIPLIEHFMPKIAQCIVDVGGQEGVSPYIYSTYNGKNIGLPNFNYNGQYHYTSLLRKDWLEALGITKTPETLDELNKAFYTLKENKQKIIDAGLSTQAAENIYGLSSGRIKEPFASIYGAYGSIPYYWEMNDDNSAVQYGAIQPGMKDALKQLAAWYADGILNPEYITGENRGDHWSISHDFVEGRILYTNNGPFYQNMPGGIAPTASKGGKMYRAYIGAGNTPESYEVVRPPIGPNGDSGSIIWGYTTGESVVFSAALEKDKAKYGKILSFLEASCTDYDYWVLQTYGIENVHWKLDDKGMRTSEGLMPEDVVQETYGIGLVFNGWAEGLGIGAKDDPAYYKYADEYAKFTNKYKDVLLGMSMPSSDLYWDELDKMQIKAYNDIIQGVQDISYFDTFVQEWLAAGGQQITDEANQWYKTASVE